MTAQIAQKITNNCQEVDFYDLCLYGISTGNILDPQARSCYEFSQKADKRKFELCSACWDGYISIYILMASKELILTGFEYPFAFNVEPDKTHEVLEGDFWLDMRPEFFSDEGYYIPFKDGKIISDRNEWLPRNKSSEQKRRWRIKLSAFLDRLS